MLKKTLALFIAALLLLFSFAACAKDEDKETGEDERVVQDEKGSDEGEDEKNSDENDDDGKSPSSLIAGDWILKVGYEDAFGDDFFNLKSFGVENDDLTVDFRIEFKENGEFALGFDDNSFDKLADDLIDIIVKAAKETAKKENKEPQEILGMTEEGFIKSVKDDFNAEFDKAPVSEKYTGTYKADKSDVIILYDDEGNISGTVEITKKDKITYTELDDNGNVIFTASGERAD